jgi:hypothetical protein
MKSQMQYIDTDGGRSRYYRYSRIGDCVIRSVALATGADYQDIFEEFTDRAVRIGVFANDDRIWRSYLKELGWQEHRLPNPRPLVNTIRVSQAVVHCRSGYSGHLTAVVQGNLHDIWDARQCKAYAYWQPQ